MAPEDAPQPRRNPVDRALGGWQPAATVMAANKLGFFTAIGEGALTAGDVAQQCGTHARSTRMLLDACVALEVMEKEGGVYRNSAEALDSLVHGRPGYMGDGVAHQHDLWTAWGKLSEAVRGNQRVAERRELLDGAEVHRNFIMAMHNRALREAPVLAETLDLTGRRQLFDAGGGPGTFAIHLVMRYEGLKAVVFDLPQTVGIARKIIDDYGVDDRVTVKAGDYFKDDFGKGNDVVLLSAILHSVGPDRSSHLLQKAHDSLVAGGLVVVHEGLIDRDGTAPVRAALFSLNMLVNTGEGQSYSADEIMAIMAATGFARPRVVSLPRPLRTSLVIGIKP